MEKYNGCRHKWKRPDYSWYRLPQQHRRRRHDWMWDNLGRMSLLPCLMVDLMTIPPASQPSIFGCNNFPIFLSLAAHATWLMDDDCVFSKYYQHSVTEYSAEKNSPQSHSHFLHFIVSQEKCGNNFSSCQNRLWFFQILPQKLSVFRSDELS